VVGFGVISLGPQQVNWREIGTIASSWIISPLLSAAISYLIFRYVLRSVFRQPNPIEAAKRVTPNLVFLVLVIMGMVTSVKALGPLWKQHGMDPWGAGPMIGTLAVTATIGVIGMLVARRLVRKIDTSDTAESLPHFEALYIARALRKTAMHLGRIHNTTTGPMRDKVANLLGEVESLSSTAAKQTDPNATGDVYRKVERIFIYLQILSACFVAFAHGANDVANAIGPLSAAVQVAQHGVVAASAAVPTWALALGGVGIVVGLATWGWRVIETIGKRITELTPTRGFCAEFGAACTILVASLLGLPVSTTHCLVGAVLGVGLARGIGAINLNTVRDILASWLITLPAGAGLAIVFFYLLRATIG